MSRSDMWVNQTDMTSYPSQRLLVVSDNRYRSRGQTGKSFWKWVAEQRKAAKDTTTNTNNDRRTVVVLSADDLSF